MEQQSLPIMDNGHLVGILTTDHLIELLMVRAALRGNPTPDTFG